MLFDKASRITTWNSTEYHFVICQSIYTLCSSKLKIIIQKD